MLSYLKNKKRWLLLLFALLPYIIWFILTITVMFPYTEVKDIITISIVLISLGISTALKSNKAKMVSYSILIVIIGYLIYEWIYLNPYWDKAYPIIIGILIVYYFLLNYISRRLKDG